MTNLPSYDVTHTLRYVGIELWVPPVFNLLYWPLDILYLSHGIWQSFVTNKGHFTHEPRAMTVWLWRLLILIQGYTIDAVCWNLCRACLLEAGLMQILGYHETFLMVCHVEICVDFSSKINFFGPSGLHLLMWSELGQSRPFWPTRDLRMQWSLAFNPVWEVAWTPKRMLHELDYVFKIYTPL